MAERLTERNSNHLQSYFLHPWETVIQLARCFFSNNTVVTPHPYLSLNSKNLGENQVFAKGVSCVHTVHTPRGRRRQAEAQMRRPCGGEALLLTLLQLCVCFPS